MSTPSGVPARPGGTVSIILLVTGAMCLLVTSIIGITDNVPGISLLLLGSSALLLGFLYRTGGSRTRTPAQQLLYWAPRTLCMVFAAFISIFALDVFGEGAGFWGTSLALLMHLIPTFLLIAVLVVSWRREWFGGILFIVLGLAYVVWAWRKFPLSTYFIIAGPLVVTGILFLINWRQRASLRPGAQP